MSKISNFYDLIPSPSTWYTCICRICHIQMPVHTCVKSYTLISRTYRHISCFHFASVITTSNLSKTMFPRYCRLARAMICETVPFSLFLICRHCNRVQYYNILNVYSRLYLPFIYEMTPWHVDPLLGNDVENT